MQQQYTLFQQLYTAQQRPVSKKIWLRIARPRHPTNQYGIVGMADVDETWTVVTIRLQGTVLAGLRKPARSFGEYTVGDILFT